VTEPKPIRITRSRVKGSRLTSPNGLPVVCVDRTSKWGNPFPIGVYLRTEPNGTKALTELAWAEARKLAVFGFENNLRLGTLKYTVAEVRRELRGKNLACWCKEGPCHADVLLEIANS
jgi:hypothetical protein